MTQEQLALETEMERSYGSDLERGTRNPSVRALGRLADALSVKQDELLKSERSENENPLAKEGESMASFE